MEVKCHYKMFKSGRHWWVMGLATVMATVGMITLSGGDKRFRPLTSVHPQH